MGVGTENRIIGELKMKCKVQLYVAGKIFYEEVYARDYKDAKETAQARNPKAKIISVTTVID